jgi:hypothetical protein
VVVALSLRVGLSAQQSEGGFGYLGVRLVSEWE